MDISLFNDFRARAAQGRRKDAAAALRAFIRTLDTATKKQHFTEWLLAQQDGQRWASRHELKTEVVGPALLEGYAKGDARSTYWLAMIGVDPRLTGNKTRLDLLKQCLTSDWEPPRVRRSLLSELLRGFRYAAHEWPAGILWGADGATHKQCDVILSEVALARELDANGNNAVFLGEFEDKVRRYQARLERKG